MYKKGHKRTASKKKSLTLSKMNNQKAHTDADKETGDSL